MYVRVCIGGDVHSWVCTLNDFLCAWLCTCVPCVCRGQRRTLDLLGLELQIAVNQIRVLWKSS